MAVGSVGKRKAERRDCHVKAQIRFDDGRQPLDCVILNFSATGARATLAAPAELPVRFKLYIPSRPETKQVLLRWRSALEFGCEYSTGVADENAVYDLMARVIVIEDAMRGALASAPKASSDGSPDEALLQRIAAIEAKLSAPPAPGVPPDVIERIARLEQEAKAHAALAELGPVSAGPDPLLIKRMADLEAKLMSHRSPAPAPLGLDLSPLEKRIDGLARSADESLARVERFLNARIDDVEASMIAAPAPPMARGADIVGMERRLLGLEQALREPVAFEGLEGLEARMSNLEMSLLEVRTEVAASPQSDAPQPDVDDEMRARIAALERRNADVMDALRNVLAMLTARSEMRATG